MLEDDVLAVEAITGCLTDAGLDFTAQSVDMQADFLRHLTEFTPDIALLDYGVPGYDGLAALNDMCAHAPLTPAIIVTVAQGEEVAVACMHAGAADYVTKSQLYRLAPAILRALEHARRVNIDITEKNRQSEEIRQQNAQLRAIIEALPDMIFTSDRDGNYLSDFKSKANMVRDDDDHVVGLNIRDAFDAPTAELHLRKIRECLDTR